MPNRFILVVFGSIIGVSTHLMGQYLKRWSTPQMLHKGAIGSCTNMHYYGGNFHSSEAFGNHNKPLTNLPSLYRGIHWPYEGCAI